MSNSKTANIRRALENGDRLTHMKALAYGTHRLAAVIFSLRKQGMNIRAVVKTDSRGARFTEYSLVPPTASDEYTLAA